MTKSIFRFIAMLSVLTLTGCLDRTTDKPTESLTLQETAQKLSGYWKLKSVMGSTDNEDDLELNQVKYFEFDRLRGFEVILSDPTDGTFQVSTHQPTCELKEREGKKIIQYSILVSSWAHEIKHISQDKLVLADSTTTWTYARHKVD